MTAHESPGDSLGADEKVPWRRNPWFYGILFCILFPPLIRPFTRTIVEAPEPTSAPVAVRLMTTEGSTFDEAALEERIHIGFFTDATSESCPEAIDTMRPLAVRMDEQAYAGRGLFAEDAGFGEEIRILVVARFGDGTPVDLDSLARTCELDSDRWVLVGGHRMEVEAFASALEGRGGEPTTFFSHQRTVIIDRSRQARGLYAMDDLGQDELYHRAQHVLRDARIAARNGARGL